MAPLPWTRLHSWSCLACGMCCRDYTPLLTAIEGIRFSKKFSGVVESCVRGFVIKKRSDGRCVFQYNSGRSWLCSIQGIKPQACQLWPFMICRGPQYGRAGEALYEYADEDIYIYVEGGCRGIIYGISSHELITTIIPEFVEISRGRYNTQFYSTYRSTFNSPSEPGIESPQNTTMHRHSSH